MTARLNVRVELEARTLFSDGRATSGPSSSMQAVNDYLKQVAAGLDRTQMGALLREVGDIYYDSIITRFKSHTDPKGQSWKHLNKETVTLKRTGMVNSSGRVGSYRPPAVKSARARNGVSIPVSPETQLIWTGRLLRAIRVVVDARRATVRIGLSSDEVPYAWVHQMGYTPNKIPMRKYLGYTKKANEAAMQAIRNFFLAAAR